MADIRLLETVVIGGLTVNVDHGIIGQVNPGDVLPAHFPGPNPEDEFDAGDYPHAPIGHLGWEATWEGAVSQGPTIEGYDDGSSNLRRIHINQLLT